MTKAEIRKHYKAKRAQLTPFELSKISAQVQALVLDTFQFPSKFVSLFLPIESQKEISTYGLLEDILLKGGHPILSKSDFLFVSDFDFNSSMCFSCNLIFS